MLIFFSSYSFTHLLTKVFFLFCQFCYHSKAAQHANGKISIGIWEYDSILKMIVNMCECFCFATITSFVVFWENICLSKWMVLFDYHTHTQTNIYTPLLFRVIWCGTRKISIHLTFNMTIYVRNVNCFYTLVSFENQHRLRLSNSSVWPWRYSFVRATFNWLYRGHRMSELYSKILWSQMFSIVSLLHIYRLYFIYTKRLFFFVSVINVFFLYECFVRLYLFDLCVMVYFLCEVPRLYMTIFFCLALVLCIIVFW